MIKELYKKLNYIFIGIIMLIITLIIAITYMNSFKTQQQTQASFFQKMTTLLIYQLENSHQNFDVVIKEYENKYPVICLLKDNKDTVLYQSDSNFATSNKKLLAKADKKIKLQTSDNLNYEKITEQSGLFTIHGNAHDKYWGITSEIFSKGEKTYDMTLIYQQESNINFMKEHFLFYTMIWISAFIVITLLSKYLLKKAIEPTKQTLDSQKNFIASASHEMKAPLAIILANAERIESLNVDNDQIEKSIKSIDSECIRMSELIKDLLDLACSDAKSWKLNQSEVNIDTLLITLYEKYEPICKKKNIQLVLDINDISFPTLLTDKERIFQILCIFLDNAIYHAKNNMKIEIHASLISKKVTFYIIDHGKGIAESDKPYLFDRFYCADKSRTDKSHFGLGLSIAEELVKMLNGEIGFKDTDGGGTTFFAMFSYK